jgi:uncharacterized membrane protein YhdT
MNSRRMKLAVSGLRLALGLVVLFESAYFVFSSGAAHQFGKTGLPLWLRPALGGSEVIAALLFLVPATSVVGGYALLFIFAIAVGVHLLHGQYDVGSVVVYAMGVFVCITQQEARAAEVPHDR